MLSSYDPDSYSSCWDISWQLSHKKTIYQKKVTKWFSFPFHGPSSDNNSKYVDLGWWQSSLTVYYWDLIIIRIQVYSQTLYLIIGTKY